MDLLKMPLLPKPELQSMPVEYDGGRAIATERVVFSALLLCCILLLAACGHRQDVMQPVATAGPGTSRVDMLVATTRQPSENPRLRYSGERGEDVRLDNIVVSIPPDANRQLGKVQWPGPGTPDPLRSFVTVRADPLEEAQIVPWLRRTSGSKKRVFLFVHGFNNSYSDAVYRFAQITHDMRAEAAPVLFTWPSRGNALDYVYDRESTIYSRFGLETVLREAVKSPDVSEVTILAHSMGTWLTMEVLRDMAIRHGNVSPKIRNVILASPDIDVDVFRRQILEMGEKRPHVTIFSSQNDLALAISTFVAGDVQRLGAADFGPYRNMLAEYGISVVDASKVKQSDPLGHSAFAENSDMLKAVSTLLVDQKLAAPSPIIPGIALLRNVRGMAP